VGVGLVRPVAAVVRTVTSQATRSGEVRLTSAFDVEVWSVAAAVVVLAAAVVLAVRHPRTAAVARGLALVPGTLVLTGPSWVAGAAVRANGADRLVVGDAATTPTAWRLALAFAVLAVTALGCAAARVGGPGARPVVATLLTWPAGLVAAAGAGLVAVTAQRTFDVPAEVATVSIGALAVALGALRLAAVPAAGSWPALGPGLLVLLVPTLVLAADGTLWRILGLVVVAAAVVAVGAARRLQAPVVVGGLVLAAHAVVQLAPYVAELTTSQWRWVVFALVGAGLLVLGATYERRLVQLRAARTRLSALR
jgi:hypothetical protein